MAAAKITAFLREDEPRVLALVGATGKKHAIAKAARQAGIAVTHHDLAQGAVHFGRLGLYQLTTTGLSRCVHVIANASEQFLNDYSWVKAERAKIVLVADDASQSMRASVPVVRMQALSAEAMAKRLYLEEDWPAEEAVQAAKAARGDWHQLHAHKHFCSGLGDAQHSAALAECSQKDELLASETPCFITNRLLNGTIPETCPLDTTVMAWAERNMGAHCNDLEAMAPKHEAMAASTAGLEGNPAGEQLFMCAVMYQSQPMQYKPGLYASPWQKDEAVVREIAESFKKRRSHSHTLKEATLQQEREADGGSTVAKRRPKTKAKSKGVKASNKAKRK